MPWHTLYHNGKLVKQFNGVQETLFKELDLEQVNIFEVELQGQIFGVCLKEAAFRIGDKIFQFEGFIGQKLQLIYFRRVRKVIGADGGDTVQHCLGFQSKGLNPNKQIIMKVSEPGYAVTFEIK